MLSRRKFLRGISMTGAAVQVGLPPLAAMFNMNGTAYAASGKAAGIDKRFLVWWNGNGIPERYWIPRETGENYELTACLSPLGRVRDYVHVLSGVDNVAARLNGQGNGHFSALCGSDDRHRLHGPWRRGPVDRSDSRREDRHEDALPLAADRRRAGVARRKRAPQHDVGGLRARAAAGTHSAEPVRSPVRREGRRLGQPQEERARPGQRRRAGAQAGARRGRQAAARPAPDVGARSRARHREPAARLRQDR